MRSITLRWRVSLFCLGLTVLRLPLPAQTPSAPKNAAAIGTLVVAHGADSAWNAPVEALVNSLATGGPVRLAYLMGPGAATHGFADVAKELEALGVREIIVVPLLVSSYSEHYRQIRWLAGLADSIDATLAQHMQRMGMQPAKVSVPVRVAAALDDADALAQVLAARARAATSTAADQALFLVAHGPNEASDYARWMDNLRRVADRVREMTGFRDVRVDAVRDDAPPHVRAEAVRRVRELIELQHALTQRDVVVVPILVSRGNISRSTLVNDLKGLPIVYRGDALLPHEALARWVEGKVRETSAAAPGR